MPVKAVNYRCRERDRSIGCRRVHPPVGFPTVGSLDTGCANSIHDGCSITSSFKTAWRTSECRKYRFILFAAIFLGAGLTVSYLEFVVIRPTPLWEGRYLVPLAGMIVTNAMNSAALGVERFRSELDLRAGEIETLLALGATQQQAVLKTVQLSASAAMLPAINMLMVLGIVALPGMMSGQILAGESPLIAVRYQLLICFSIAATAAIVTWVSIQMTQKLYFTKDDQFIRTQDSGD